VPLHEFTPTQATEALLAEAVVPLLAQPDKINAAALIANKVPLFKVVVIIFNSSRE
jgi:hypothetical protein